VRNYFKPSTAQQRVLREEIVVKKEGTKVDTEPKFYCRYCGAENPSDAVFCEKCGKQIKEM
jgi:rRNA maturation endonuclease Nob1